MGYRSKTYSLSDDVVEAIEREKAAGTSPNRLLRRLLGLDGKVSGEKPAEEAAVVNSSPVANSFEGRKFYRRDR